MTNSQKTRLVFSVQSNQRIRGRDHVVPSRTRGIVKHPGRQPEQQAGCLSARRDKQW